MTNDVESTGAPEIRAFLATEIQRTSAASAQVHYRNLRVYFGWLVREGERESPNPLESVDKPKADQQVKRSSAMKIWPRCSRSATDRTSSLAATEPSCGYCLTAECA